MSKITGLILIFVGYLLYSYNINAFTEKIEVNKTKHKIQKEPKIKIQNNTSLKILLENLFWKPDPWNYLHGYKVNIKDKRFY